MPSFGPKSQKSLKQCHWILQEIFSEAIKTVDFTLLDGYRGEVAQTIAFKTGHSKARWGQSAHNYKPCVACDWMPYPFKGWKDKAGFKKVADAILAAAKVVAERHKLPKLKVRWGGDFNMDGDKTTSDSWDGGHVELHPWRNYVGGKNG